MFSIFKRKNRKGADNSNQDWSFLGTDIHSHFIPGIDDGPAAMTDSLLLLQGMQAKGFRKVITTPHISLDYFPNSNDKIREGLEQLQAAAQQAGLLLELEAAAEYMIDEAFMKKLQQREPLLYFGDRYVLIEMGFVQAHPLLPQAIFELQALGYKPVLAHPERYNYYHGNPEVFVAPLKAQGCLLQLNTIALSGYYGRNVKAAANKMLNAGLYDFTGSDVHHQRHLNAFNEVLNLDFATKLKSYPFLNNIL